MLERLQSGRSFEALHGPTFSLAVDELLTKFTADLEKDKTALRCHGLITMGLKNAVESGVQPKLVGRARYEGGQELFAIQMGKEVFPMLVASIDWDNTAIEIYPALKARDFDAAVMSAKGIAGIYGEKREKLDRLAVIRGQGSTTHLTVKGGDKIKDVSYAWALYEVAASVIRRAVVEPKTTRELEPAMGFEVERKERLGSEARIVNALLEGHFESAKESGGPFLAHELLGAFVHRGRTVAVTSTKDGEGIRVSVESGEIWRPLPVPSHDSWPLDAATPVMVGDQLHFFGGLGPKAKVLSSHYTMDLTQIEDPSPSMFKKHADLSSPMAWAAAVFNGREAFLGGGIAGFMVKAGEKRERQKILRQGFSLLGNNGELRDRAPAPGDITRSYAFAHAGCLFFAPGQALDGKVRIYDNAQGGAWFSLKLPIQVGLGQLFLVDKKLYYAGGSTEEGPSNKIFEADLGQPNPKFVEVGSAAHCEGPTRIVDRNGSLQAIMIKPGASKTHTADVRS